MSATIPYLLLAKPVAYKILNSLLWAGLEALIHPIRKNLREKESKKFRYLRKVRFIFQCVEIVPDHLGLFLS